MNAKQMLAHPAHLMAMGFGSGLSPIAPGTIGTLWAWLSFVLLSSYLVDVQWAILIIVSFLLGWWACMVTAKNMGVSDPSYIVWDEIVAFWLVLLVISPAGFWGQFIAFALFRFFDAVKFGPVAWADQSFKGFGACGGFGIMFDDLVAAFCTLLVFAIWRSI